MLGLQWEGLLGTGDGSIAARGFLSLSQQDMQPFLVGLGGAEALRRHLLPLLLNSEQQQLLRSSMDAVYHTIIMALAAAAHAAGGGGCRESFFTGRLTNNEVDYDAWREVGAPVGCALRCPALASQRPNRRLTARLPRPPAPAAGAGAPRARPQAAAG